MNSNQGSYDDLIQIALDGLREVQEKSPEELRQWVSRQPLLPSTVPVGRDRSVPITSEGYSALKKLGRTWHANDATRLRLLSRTAAEELAVYAFGDLLSAAGDPPAAADAKSELLRGMDKRFQARTQPEHFYFPARVFDQPEVQTFAIYRRVEWLDAVETLAGAPCSWKAEVLDRWTNRQSRLRHILNSLGEWFTGKILKHWPGRSLAHKLLRLRTHRSYVDDILKAVGACEWVMAVAVEGRERSRLSECAFVAGLVALDSLGPPMRASAARNLRGPGHERGPQLQHDLHQPAGQPLSFSISLDLPRLGGPPGLRRPCCLT
jgi:hypothetical protein